MIVLGESWVPIFESHFHLSPLGIRASLALSLTWLRPKSDSLILNMSNFYPAPKCFDKQHSAPKYFAYEHRAPIFVYFSVNCNGSVYILIK